MRRRFVYSIEGLSRKTHMTMGSFGFGAYLDLNFAKKAFETELPQTNRFNEIGELIIRDCSLVKGDEKIYHPVFNFVENKKGNLTCLVHYINVPGDACDLGIEGSVLSNIMNGKWKYVGGMGALEYGPHNIDNHLQAYALLSAFTTWADLTSSFLDFSFIEE